jgi:hypothetical protein|tara:strand:- start:940 stop:1203 length:264 start_codon:yes stop_codon:yes gene_type:complete
MGHISKTDPNRWFIVQSAISGEPGIIVFGSAGDQGVNELGTGQPILRTYLSENTLESIVNTVANIPDYYKDSIETESEKFQGPSGKY